MATTTLTIVIEDVELSKQMMEDGFLKMYSMDQIPDPDWVDPEDGSSAPLVDKFQNTKKLAEDKLANWIVKIINKGLVRISQEDKQVFTKEMIITT
jgi:hypothetical protein